MLLASLLYTYYSNNFSFVFVEKVEYKHTVVELTCNVFMSESARNRLSCIV